MIINTYPFVWSESSATPYSVFPQLRDGAFIFAMFNDDVYYIASVKYNMATRGLQCDITDEQGDLVLSNIPVYPYVNILLGVDGYSKSAYGYYMWYNKQYSRFEFGTVN